VCKLLHSLRREQKAARKRGEKPLQKRRVAANFEKEAKKQQKKHCTRANSTLCTEAFHEPNSPLSISTSISLLLLLLGI
jgi:hypothetical protein